MISSFKQAFINIRDNYDSKLYRNEADKNVCKVLPFICNMGQDSSIASEKIFTYFL
jgi:hypothetical protein